MELLSGVGVARLLFSHRADEPVTLSGKGFDKTRVFRRIAQRLSQPADCLIQALIEIHKGASRPELLDQLFTGDELAGRFEKRRQDVEGLVLEDDLVSVAMQLGSLKVENAVREVNGL